MTQHININNCITEKGEISLVGLTDAEKEKAYELITKMKRRQK